MPKISIEHLNFSYRKRKNQVVVFEDFNTVFSSNKINVILGESGCGKTTLLKCICGLNDYDGIIKFDSIDCSTLLVRERNIGYLNQNFAMYPHMTLFDSIAYPLKMSGVGIKEIRERVYNIASQFDIADLLSRKPKQISIGQLQRACLARALIKNPSICLFDEPLSNLDMANRTSFRHYLRRFLSTHITTVVYVTHNLEEATSLADNIYVMKDGKIVFEGTPLDLINSNDPYIKEILSTIVKNNKEEAL